MSNIQIERYQDQSVTKDWAGCVYDDAESWIIFLDKDGRPSLYWPERDENGGVIGEPIVLGK
jgi:hypothetical protein